MKNKRIGISVLTLILGLICGLGFISIPKQEVKASAAAEITYTQYMLENGAPVKKENLTSSAGKLYVKGNEITSQEELSFVLTEQNIELRAEANLGFELKGWYVTYKDKTDVVDGTISGYVSITTSEQKICAENIVISEYLTLNKTAKLRISEMQDSLIIAPVFDYQYYTVTYKGVKTQENIGEFKYGDLVSINKEIVEGVNVDAESLVSSQITLTKDAGEEFVNGEYKFTQDVNKRTTKVEVKFEMNVYEDVVIELRYDVLYRVDLELCLEETKITTVTEYDEVKSCVNVNEDKAFSKIDGTDFSYFVKNGAGFKVECASDFKNGGGYVYYEFASLDGSTVRNLNLNGISADKSIEKGNAIQVNYTHKKYNVTFVGVEYNSTDKTVFVNSDLLVEDSKQLTRVDGSNSVTLNDAILKENIGYNHLGFVKLENGKTQYDLLTDKIENYTLSKTEPKDTVIYVVYQNKEYALNLTSLKDVSLVDTKENITYYPIKSINGVEIDYSVIEYDKWIVKDIGGNTVNYKIGDTITLELKLNNGFNVNAIAGMSKQEDTQIYTLTLDKDFLTGKNSTIDLAISAETLKYTLTYKIKEEADLKTMADIDVEVEGKDVAWEDLNILKEDKNNDTENFIDDGYHHIKVSNLTYYQNVILKSKANRTGNANEYFVFRYFTYDFNTSISGVTGDGLTPETQILPLVINGDVTVFVVYTQPKTQLKIVVDSAPADAGISFVVTQLSDVKTAVDGLYTLQQESIVSIAITGLVNNEKLFGFDFKNVELYTFDGENLTIVSGQTSYNRQNYSFTPDSGDLYIVLINIEKIVYEFNFTANLPGFNIAGAFLDTFIDQLTVDKAEIKFEKAIGYYVNQVYIDKDGISIDWSSSMAQTNLSRSGQMVNGMDYFSIYYYNFGNAFKNIIEEYGVFENGKVKVDIFMSFVKYEYEISVGYVKYDGDTLNSSVLDMVYPTIRLGYKFTNDPTEEIIYANYESLPNVIKFVGVPYGANVTLEVVRGVSAGFKMKGWYDSKGENIIHSDIVYQDNDKLLKYSRQSNKADFALTYRVDFEEYKIKLLSSISGAGSPKINGADSVMIKMGDGIKIEPNASLADGYLFKEFEYKVNKLVEYTYIDDAQQFALDWDKLYIKDDNGYIFKNISSLRNDDYDYYTLESEYAVTDVKIFEEVFNIADYYANSNEIVFELVYVPVEMTIENISLAAAQIDLETGEVLRNALDLVSLGLTEEDLADYIVYASNGSNEREIIENNEDYKITINDTIRIVVQINRAAIGNKVYDLTKGLILNETSLDKNLLSENKGDGQYEITFKVAEVLKPEFAEIGKIKIEYKYIMVESKNITVTTNMAESEDFINRTLLKISGITESESKDAVGKHFGSISQKNPFLQNVNVTLDLNDLKSNFVIHSVTIYKDYQGNGERLESNIIQNEEFLDYWIKTNESTLEDTDRTVISSVDLTILDIGIIIQFNLQPRIKIEGEEITTQLEKWIFRTYKFEVKNEVIQGLAQEIKLGEDISGYGMEYLAVEIWQNGAKLTAGAINSGEYVIKLVFKDGISEEEQKNCWKYYINELPCVIKLRINPIDISVRYDKNKTKGFEKEYDSKSGYNLNATILGTELISGDGKIVLTGKYGNDLSFDLGLLNIAGGEAEIVVGNVVEGLKSQKDVTGNYVHIFITGLELKNNKNFNLKFNTYDYYINVKDTEKRLGVLVENVVKIVPKVIYIENLEVYDKVYNGNEVAQFGLVEGQTGYRIKHVFTGDDIRLLPEELKIYFTNSPITKEGNLVDILDGAVGGDKYIVIDARTALDGRDKSNYIIGDLSNGLLNYKDRKTIYPYQITAVIKGVGNITLTNTRGLTDYTKASLIPVGAKVSLIAERIEQNSVGYREIEEKISSYLSRRNTFASGYKLFLLDNNGMKVKISNELFLTLPNEEDLKSVVSIAGDRVKNIQYTFDIAGNVVIDLSQIEEDISTFCLIQNRALLKAWQIVLIVVLSLVVAAGIGVAVFFIIRRRRKKNEKYDVI